MIFKAIVLVTHLSTGHTAIYTDTTEYKDKDVCLKSLPARIDLTKARAEFLAKYHGQDSQFDVKADCIIFK